MKFSLHVDIDLPIDKVIELFDNTDNMMKWQEGLLSFEHLEGEPGQPGAKSKLVYKNGSKTFDLYEEITVRNLPEEFSGYYDHVAMRNSMNNSFASLSDNQTRWSTEIEYEFKTTMWKIMSLFMKPMFKKQTLGFMKNFKKFAETGEAVTS